MPRPKDDRRKPTARRDLWAHERNSGHHFRLERLRGGTGPSTTSERIAAEEQAERDRVTAQLRKTRDEIANRTG